MGYHKSKLWNGQLETTYFKILYSDGNKSSRKKLCATNKFTLFLERNGMIKGV